MPSDVCDIYRRRDIIEKFNDSLKNFIDMRPSRVWSENSVKDISLCFLAQVIVLMICHEHRELQPQSTKFIIRSLEKLTFTLVYSGKPRTDAFIF